MNRALVSAAAVIGLPSGTAFAGTIVAVPIPVAGVAGPVGVGVAVAAYVGYRVWTRHR